MTRIIVDTSTRLSPDRRWAMAASAATILLLTGCAQTRISNQHSATLHTMMPTALRIEVESATDLAGNPNHAKLAQQLATDLTKGYAKTGLTIVPSANSTSFPGGMATLHVRLTDIQRGSRLERVVIGFGAGRSSLSTDVSLALPDADSPALTFSAKTRSTPRPGLILPGGIAAATGNVVHLAIGGGADILLSARGGLAHDADRSASAIIRETRRWYERQGWCWPAEHVCHPADHSLQREATPMPG